MEKLARKLLWLTLIPLVFSCKDPEPQEPYDVFAGCCETQNPRTEVGKGVVFIPTMFTPNGDGVNDVFYPIGNPGVERFENFEIRDQLGFTLYEQAFLLADDPQKAWNPGPFYGKFQYSFTAYDTLGFAQAFFGASCAFVCDTAQVGSISRVNCLFPDQYDPMFDTIYSTADTCIQ